MSWGRNSAFLCICPHLSADVGARLTKLKVFWILHMKQLPRSLADSRCLTNGSDLKIVTVLDADPIMHKRWGWLRALWWRSVKIDEHTTSDL